MTAKLFKPCSPKGRADTQTLVSAAILFFLAAVAGGVLVKQAHYDRHAILGAARQRGEKAAETPDETTGSDETQSGFPDVIPENCERMGEAEFFDADSLSDKINGKAELYLAGEFQSLSTQRVSLSSNPDNWFEIYIYDMGDVKSAFSVYSQQRRDAAEFLELAPRAYAVENAVFFMHGPYYVEIISAATLDEVKNAMIGAAQNIVAHYNVEKTAAEALDFPPEKNRVPRTEKYYMKNAFGFQGLNDVMTAEYEIDGARLTAFTSMRETEGEAAETAKAYRDFLLEMGAEKADLADPDLPDLYAVDVLGDYELIFSSGPRLLGVHGAKDKEAALKLAKELIKEF